MHKSLLLCPATYFSVKYKINPWMNPSIPVAQKLALKQWQALLDTYENLSLSINVISPVSDLPDMVFAANGFFSIGKKAVVARYRYKQRQGEAVHYTRWLKDHDFEVIDPTPIVYEAQGDTLLVEDLILQGYGFRSDSQIVRVLSSAFPNKKVVPLRLVDERFYHLDICCFPINRELVYFYDKALDQKSVNTITKLFKQAIAVSDEEALSFALNSVALDHAVITNIKAKRFSDRLSAQGFNVIELDMSEFIKSGGSVKCLTNELWEEKQILVEIAR